MSFVLLGACLTLAAFAVASVAAAPLTLLAWRWLRRRGAGADALLFARASASGAALLLAAAVVLPAYLAFEPAHAEAPGATLLLLAAAGAVLMGAGALRLFRAVRATRALLRGCRHESPLPPGSAALMPPDLPATTIAHGFPLVAVVGSVAPRLVMASQVLEALDPSEMAAVVRHEAAHLASRDNLKALFIRALPDPLALLPSGRRLEAAWRQAAEAEADASAAEPGSPAALDLASALIKIARLVPLHQRLPVAEPALYDGGPLENRVQRLTGLVAVRPVTRPLPWAVATAATLAALLLASAGTPLLFRVHGMLETVVRTLR